MGTQRRPTPPAEARALHLRGLAYGYEFIEKFIQLPFRLPPSTAGELGGFIEKLLTVPAGEKPPSYDGQPGAATPGPTGANSGGRGNDPAGRTPPVAADETAQPAPVPKPTSPGETAEPPPPKSQQSTNAAAAIQEKQVLGDERHLAKPLAHAAAVLEGNPRRIKQLVNLVRLQRRLLPHLGASVTDGQLAKWTAVALRWPVFLVDLEQDPGLLGDLVAAGRPPTPSPRYLHWESEAALVEFLRGKGPGENPDDYDLTPQGVVASLLRLGVAMPVAQTAAAATAG